jgi:hypothetical protein
MHKCNTIIDKNQQKYLVQIKRMALKPSTLIKTHKDDKPIRPIICNIQAPSYQLAKYLNKRINQLIKLLFTCATKNSKEVGQDLNNIQIK